MSITLVITVSDENVYALIIEFDFLLEELVNLSHEVSYSIVHFHIN